MQKQKVSSYLSHLLFSHNCVIIPGFGGFVGNFHSAEIHPTLHTIHPPFKSILFNKNLTTNDGLLLNTIASGEKISFEEATIGMNEFVKDIEARLRNKESVVLHEIGKFFLDIEGNLQFMPDDQSNFLLSSFGLKSVKFAPILRREPVVNTQRVVAEEKKPLVIPKIEVQVVKPEVVVAEKKKVEKPLREETRKKRSYFDRSLAAVVILMFAISTFTILDLNHPRLHQQTSSLLDSLKSVFGMDIRSKPVEKPTPPAPKVETPKPVQKDTAINSTTDSTPAVQKKDSITHEVPEQKTEPTPVEVESGKGYYIILGAFKDRTNAVHFVDDLQGEIPSVDTFENMNGHLVKVGFFSSTDKAEAKEQLEGVRGSHPDAWLLRKK